VQLETSVQTLSATERGHGATAAQLAQSIARASCSLRGLRTGRSALQCVAVRILCALQCVAERRSTCRYYSKHCNAARYVVSRLVDILTATHCNGLDHMLQHTATRALASRSLHGFETGRQSHCNTLQRTATHCNTLQRTATHLIARCNALQHTAAHCNTLQHTATHYSTLQHTAAHCSTL